MSRLGDEIVANTIEDIQRGDPPITTGLITGLGCRTKIVSVAGDTVTVTVRARFNRDISDAGKSFLLDMLRAGALVGLIMPRV